jgi:hypothetical protein
MIDEGDCGAIGGMKIGRGNRSTRENLPQSHFVHHKSHLTRLGLEPGPPLWEDPYLIDVLYRNLSRRIKEHNKQPESE